MPQIRLIALSSLFALLIWAMADHSLTETATLQVQLKLEPAGEAGMHVKRLEPESGLFEVQVSGKKTKVAQLRARDPLPVHLKVSDRSSGKYKLLLLDELSNQESELTGLVVQAVSPKEMEVLVDRELTRNVAIYVLPGTLDHEVPPAVAPTEVEITVSELAFNQIDPADCRVLLNPDDYLVNAERGKPQSISVRLTQKIAGVEVSRFNPATVTLEARLRERLRQEATITAVPIRIEASLEVFNGYNVDVRDAGAVLTRTVKVKGPPESVEQLQAGQIKLTGVVVLTAADRGDPGRYRYTTPRFNLPEGVELAGDVEPIEFRLVPRPAAPPDTQ